MQLSEDANPLNRFFKFWLALVDNQELGVADTLPLASVTSYPILLGCNPLHDPRNHPKFGMHRIGAIASAHAFYLRFKSIIIYCLPQGEASIDYIHSYIGTSVLAV